MKSHLWVVAGCILYTAVCSWAHAQGQEEHFTEIDPIVCPEGILRFLPGDYYFCAGNQALQRGNIRKALAMYESSAAWGDKRAMFNMGLLRFRGEGVPKDEPLGLAWLALSAERKSSTHEREVLAGAWKAARPEIRDAANVLWNRMKIRYADRVALVRARKQYERATSSLRHELLIDPLTKIQLDGTNTWTGAITLGNLDKAAAEAILRPLKEQEEDVTVGTPEMVRDPK